MSGTPSALHPHATSESTVHAPTESRTEPVTRPNLPTQPPCNQCLLIGLDTLDLGVYADWGDDWQEVMENFEALKEAASDNTSRFAAFISVPPPGPFLVLPGGKAPMYRFHLQATDFHLWIGGSQTPRNNTPNVYASLSSEQLWRKGVKEMVQQLKEGMRLLGAKVELIQPSRADICADFYAPGGFCESQLHGQTVCDSGERRTFYNANRLSSYYVGATGGAIKMRLYHKSLEIREHPDRAFFKEYWGVPDESEVWRVEFQLVRPFLKDLQINTVNQLQVSLRSLWRYLTQEWLTLREGEDSNRSRRPVAEFWRSVQEAGGCLNGEAALVHREEQEKIPQAEWYLSRIGNYLVTLAALWRISAPGAATRKIMSSLRAGWRGEGFADSVARRAIEKGWPVPEERGERCIRNR